MSYFTSTDFNAVQGASQEQLEESQGLQDVHRKMADLHRHLYEQMKNYNVRLMSLGVINPIAFQSVTASSTTPTQGVLSVRYIRSLGVALTVERLMGRENISSSQQLKPRHHPIIELRLTPQHLSLEFVLPASAWYDQENLMGKLTIARHRQTFFTLLSRLDPNTKIGFWRGELLSEMHVSVNSLHQSAMFTDWFNTFTPRQDDLRLGLWYAPNTPELEPNWLKTSLIERVLSLYHLHEFIGWTSDNHFRELFISTP